MEGLEWAMILESLGVSGLAQSLIGLNLEMSLRPNLPASIASSLASSSSWESGA